MITTTVSRARWFLTLVFLLNLPIQNAVSAPAGAVDYALEWGSSSRTYTYVFSGLVTCQRHPCRNARIDLNLETAAQGVILQTTRTGEDGRYQLEVTLKGSPSDSSVWRLAAHSANVSNQEFAEAEGRVILIEGQTQVVVDRSLLLTEA